MTSLRIAVASLAVLGLAGCASMDEQSSSRISPQRTTAAVVPDDEYVARIESAARSRNLDVHWINVPKKRVQRDD